MRRASAPLDAGALDWLSGFDGPVVFVLPAADHATKDALRRWLRQTKVDARMITQHRPGLYAALNDGIAAVGTEYTQQVGVDDQAYWWTHDRLADVIGPTRPVWIVGRCHTRHVNGRRTGAGLYRELMHRLAPVMLPLTNVVGSPAIIFRTDAARQVGGWDESMPAAADYDLWLKLHAIQRPTMIGFATGRFLVSPDTSLTRTFRRASLDDCYRSRIRYFGRRPVPLIARGYQAVQLGLQNALGE